MYINKIDELIDKIVDNFYNTVVVKSSVFHKIIKEINFVKYQKQINDILIDYNKVIDDNEIRKIVDDNDNVVAIREIIKRYIAYYLFLYIGFMYNIQKSDTYKNNIIEFSRNQYNYDYKIDNFFNSDSNANIIKLYTIIKNITTLISVDKSKLLLLSKKPEYIDAVKILNEFGSEFVLQNFKLKNLKGDKFEQGHNIVKTIIISELYVKNEKADVFNILESTNKDKGEFIFINIVVPKTTQIDYNTIELILDKKDVQRGLVYELYDMIASKDERVDLTVDEKILEILNKKIVVPITEDFLLFHKNTERYDKQLSMEHGRKPKKEETKIRYIVSKIDNASELYSPITQKNNELKKKIEKLFYLPMADRLIVLINNNEEIKIINKMDNLSRISIEDNEYYNDLLNYRIYAYVNFKNLSKDGFHIDTNKTIDTVRYVSFDQEKKQKDNKVEFRVAGSRNKINIVGYMIPTNIVPLQCLKLKDIHDIRKLKFKGTKTNNGYDGILNMLRHILLKKKKYKTSTYWLFNNKIDTVSIDKYEQLTKLTDEQQTKLISSKLYDDLLDIIYIKLLKIINAKKEVSFYYFKKLMLYIQKNILYIPHNIYVYNQLEKIVYFEKYIKSEQEYDENEDKFPGLYGNVIKLPTIKHKDKSNILKIRMDDKKTIIEDEEITDAEKYSAICQHHISWEKISALRKKNPGEFIDLMYHFISQYVIENETGDFICKSCGIQIKITHYKNDGAYDDDGNYRSFGTPMNISIKDIPQYDKYHPTVKYLDKQIEMMGIRFNLPYYVGTRSEIKSRRNGLIKDVIDIVVAHNKNMLNVYKSRIAKREKMYGIGTSDLYIFPLDNSIFTHSSKDKDKYKLIKRNNVLVYIMFILILELNDSQILHMLGDKYCNYFWFIKYGYNLFNNIKIRKNNKGDIVPIKKYITLCYVIYFMSCMAVRYNMWYTEPLATKKVNPALQKIIINTIVDCMNSVMELYSTYKDKQIYIKLYLKLFNKIDTVYANNDIVKKINELQKQKITKVNNKIVYKKTTIKVILLPKIFKSSNYNGTVSYKKCTAPIYHLIPISYKFTYYYNISNITNCDSGEFHQWKPQDKDLVCSVCNKKIDKLTFNKTLTNTITKRYETQKLRELAKYFCVSGELHQYTLSTKVQCTICEKCKTIDSKKLTDKQLNELHKNIVNMRDEILIENIANVKRRQAKKKSLNEYRESVINGLKSKYGETKKHKEDYFNFITKFVNLIESIVGKNYNIDNKNIFLMDDAYIITHDHNGYQLKKPIIIKDSRKIMDKKNHPFFKTNVMYYINKEHGGINVFYDSTTYLLLGYKESNKNFQYAKVKNVYLKINYSILNKLKLIGYTGKYVNIENIINNYKKYYKNSQTILRNTIADISRIRIDNLKKVIMDIQRYTYRIIYNYEILDENLSEYNIYKEFVDMYKPKLNKMTLTDVNNKNIFLANWDTIKYNLFFQNIDTKTVNIDINNKYVLAEDIGYYDYHGNLILFYIIKELTKLIGYNQKKFIKINVVHYILDLIDKLFNAFNEEYKTTIFEIKRFNYMLKSKGYILDVEEKGHGIEDTIEDTINDYTGDYVNEELTEEILDQREHDVEENDAMDIDVFGAEGLDYAIDYVPGVNIS